MLLALQQLQSQFAFTIAIVDIDADEALVRQYDELVPVLIGIGQHGEAHKLCHYFLDHQAVSAFLAG
jgi:hypothetical protein